ncbi:hypothetical protein CEUSTIGMA_g13119.t1 [Chlamydomonas eustigma]|uniref:mitogen-activated protein kinase n=1 Tax=Chlamydomonas eustigma TaxID=1157962 RepID=A0A250XRM2_9CHLO|nr:hypothetical protein CEUSTIGMA_g13119.t1 [Chlamydomonas eustigma]|eukprot:GAX85705.1 hypothetical protein CEUSTIGMA_g13119.t1 [Chlamydomonas eustigma]
MMGKLANKCKNWFRKLNSEQQEGEAVGESESASKIGNFHATERSKTADTSTAAEEKSKMPIREEYMKHPVANSEVTQNEIEAKEASANSGTVEQSEAPSVTPERTLAMDARDFFTEYGEANRYAIREVIGKGSYGIVCSATDNFTGEKVAIKKITSVFEHVSDATRILREIKLLRMLKHPDIVEIKHIMLPPSPREFKDIYVVFELMETDLHQVIKANDDLTPEHHQFFLYQMLRGLKYIHSAKVFHRDLKPKNILANADCKLKICDFGLARPSFSDMPTTIFWTDYVATRWYRAPELCGSFFAKYSPSIDIWSIGCIFAEVLLGRPLFPGKNVVHQLELITDLLGSPSPDIIAKVRNEKARRFLNNMDYKPGVSLSQVFPHLPSKGVALLRRMLSFDPSERPTAEEALADPYFSGLHSPSREPSAHPVSKLAFEFDRRKLGMDEVRDLIYSEILEYHPAARQVHTSGASRGTFTNPSALDNFKRQFMHLESNPGAIIEPGSNKGRRALGSATSLPKEWATVYQAEAVEVLVRSEAAAAAATAAAAAAAGGATKANTGHADGRNRAADPATAASGASQSSVTSSSTATSQLSQHQHSATSTSSITKASSSSNPGARQGSLGTLAEASTCNSKHRISSGAIQGEPGFTSHSGNTVTAAAKHHSRSGTEATAATSTSSLMSSYEGVAGRSVSSTAHSSSSCSVSLVGAKVKPTNLLPPLQPELSEEIEHPRRMSCFARAAAEVSSSIISSQGPSNGTHVDALSDSVYVVETENGHEQVLKSVAAGKMHVQERSPFVVGSKSVLAGDHALCRSESAN